MPMNLGQASTGRCTQAEAYAHSQRASPQPTSTTQSCALSSLAGSSCSPAAIASSAVGLNGASVGGEQAAALAAGLMSDMRCNRNGVVAWAM